MFEAHLSFLFPSNRGFWSSLTVYCALTPFIFLPPLRRWLEALAPVYALARFLPIFSYLFVPLFANRFGNVKCLIMTRIANGAVIAVFALSSDFQTAALFVAYRLLLEFAMPVRQSFATEIAEPSQVGAMLGISNFTRQFVQSFAPTIAGYLFEFASFTTPIFSGAALIAINGVQYHIFYRKRGED